MGIDHRGTHILMTKQFLDRANVISVFRQMGCKTVAKGMAAGSFVYTCYFHGIFHRLLKTIFVNMIPSVSPVRGSLVMRLRKK